MILLKNQESFWTFFSLGPLADQPEFVAVIDFPFDDLTGYDIDGSGQRQGQIDIALRDTLFTSDGLNLCGVLHDY
jgi:hypothetical protein